MKIQAQRLRNLTTGRLHTEIGHIYEDLETITGEKRLMTHMLPRANDAVKPWLAKHVQDERFWEDKWDQSHTGEIELPDPSDDDRKTMIDLYLNQADPFLGKTVIAAVV